MKKKLALLLSFMLLLTCFALTACGGGAETEEPAEEPAQEEAAAEESTEALDDPVNGAIYGYAGEDPVEAAVYQYMVEQMTANFDVPEGAVSIPVVQIVSTSTDEESGDVHALGEFEIMNYEIDGDTLKMISGGSYPGDMTLIQVGSGYSATDLKVCEDGGNFEESAKEIFGDSYDDFIKVQADDQAREKLRGEIIAEYVRANGLEVTKYQDEGWDPVDIPL